MLLMLTSEPFEPQQFVMRVDFEFKGLPHLVVSGNSFVQLEHQYKNKTANFKRLEVKQSQRLKYVYFQGRKYSKSELHSRKIKVEKVIKVPFIL